MQLTGHWINWANPQFFSGEFVSQEDDWNAFFTEQRKHHPYLPNDLAPALQEIHSVKIFRQTSAFEFCLEYDQSLRHHFDPDIRHIQAP
jgi:hypothetical protein